VKDGKKQTSIQHCKLCGGEQMKLIRDTLRYDIKRRVLRCEGCSFIQLERNVSDGSQYTESKEYKDQYGPAPYHPSSCQEIFDTYLSFQGDIIKEIEAILPRAESILDIGCQTGHLLHALEGQIPTRVGLELNTDDVSFIKKTLDFPIYDKPIETVSIKEAPFDLITAIQVLEHIDDLDSFLEGIKRNLKEGGHVYIEVPNARDVLITGYKNKAYEKFFYYEPHLNYFSNETLERLLAKHGFSGTTKTVQRYSLLNHIHWMHTGRPQNDFTVGNSVPALIEKKDTTDELSVELNKLIAEADLKYKSIVQKHGVGEVLIFLGKKNE